MLELLSGNNEVVPLAPLAADFTCSKKKGLLRKAGPECLDFLSVLWPESLRQRERLFGSGGRSGQH